jgi:manganese/zinc/iron transport system permease protein
VTSAVVIQLVGGFVAASCALVGTFLVLRRMALLGDAISHAVLPGIVIAFLLTGSRAALPMVLGASVLGVVTVFLVGVLTRSRRLYEDTSIGVVFPALFSVGVILVSRYASQVDLDLDCVLHGEIGLAPLDTLVIGGQSVGSKALWVTGGTLLLNLALVLLLYKELKIASFDPDLAAALGFSPLLVHYVLMSAVSVTVVGSFESVGAILVVAMLVVPAATAYLFTNRLSTMLFLAVGIGVASSSAGYNFARWYDCSIAGAMAAAAGGFFVLGLLLSPRNGLIARAYVTQRLRGRLNEQLVLLHLKRQGDALPAARASRAESVQERFGWSPARWRRVVRGLEARGLVESAGEDLQLTAAGARALEQTGTSVLVHRQ